MDIVREAEILAKIACVVERHMCKMTKQADGELTSGMKGGIIGGLGGAAIGGAGNVLLRKYLEKRYGLKKEPMFGHAAIGALVGGAAGMGGGYLLGNKGVTTPDSDLKFNYTSPGGQTNQATVQEYMQNAIAHNNQSSGVGAVTNGVRALTPSPLPTDTTANYVTQAAYPIVGAGSYLRSKGDVRGLSREGPEAERMLQVKSLLKDKADKDAARLALRSSGEKARAAAAEAERSNGRLIQPLSAPRIDAKTLAGIQKDIYGATNDHNTAVNDARAATQKIKAPAEAVGTSVGQTAMSKVLKDLASKGITTTHPDFKGEFLKEWKLQNSPVVGAVRAGIWGDVAGQGIRAGANTVDLGRALWNNSGNAIRNLVNPSQGQ